MCKNRALWSIFFPLFFLSLVACVPHYKVNIGNLTIAVWDLDDVSPNVTPQHELKRLFADRIIEIIIEKSCYGPVIEREHLEEVLREQNIDPALVDEATRLKVGKLIGARLMIFGGYQVIGDTMRVDLRLDEVESGKVIQTVQKTRESHNVSEWFDAVSEAAQELLKQCKR